MFERIFMRGSFIKAFILIITLLFNTLSVFAGLPSDTPILTPQGMVPLRQLKKGSKIIVYDPETHVSAPAKIKNIAKHESDIWIKITTDRGVIECSAGHRFYEYSRGFDKSAEDFDALDVLISFESLDAVRLSCRSEAVCLSIEITEEKRICYDIELDEHEKVHYYIATDARILTHNSIAIPVMRMVGQVIIANKEIILAGLEAAISAFTAGQAVKEVVDEHQRTMQKNKAQSDDKNLSQTQTAAEQEESQASTSTNSQTTTAISTLKSNERKKTDATALSADKQGPRDPKEKLKYERNPAHKIGYATKEKSPAFDNDTEGQRWLEASQLADEGGNSTRRIVVMDDDLYGVFNRTRVNTKPDGSTEHIYHGHKGPWKQLKEHERQLFIRNGLTNHKGKLFNK